MARNNTIQDLLDLYQNLIDEFKDVHKRTRIFQKENASEIINDIKEMAVERDIGNANYFILFVKLDAKVSRTVSDIYGMVLARLHNKTNDISSSKKESL